MDRLFYRWGATVRRDENVLKTIFAGVGVNILYLFSGGANHSQDRRVRTLDSCPGNHRRCLDESASFQDLS